MKDYACRSEIIINNTQNRIEEFAVDDMLLLYKKGLERLLIQLDEEEHSAFSAVETYQARLLENLFSTDLHGDTETLRATRSQIIKSLNEVTHKFFKMSFVKYCMSNTSSTLQEHSEQQQNEYYIQTIDYIKVVQRNIEEVHKLFGVGKMWYARCENIYQVLLHIDKLLLYDSTSTSSLTIHLSFVREKISELLIKLSSFCPLCYKTNKSIKSQQQEIYALLKLLMQRCKDQAF